MNDLLPPASTNVVIGVCGDQNAGKTIFLTCIFQSIWTACPDDMLLDFDRHEIGNANHFQFIEDQLIKKAKSTGTDTFELFPARIYVKPLERLPGVAPAVLSVDIKDFAGGHFRSLADLTSLGNPRASDSAETKALREVNETIQHADALIILIDSTQIDPLDDTPKSNPFTPSVNFLLSHCRAENKPVALLFSKADQTQHLTDEIFRKMPRVQAFQRQFTSDLTEGAEGKRPFGIVRRIACYETVEGDLAPIRQTMDGSIWRPEPAKIVLDLLRAAMPRINARIQAAIDEKRKDDEQAALAAKKRQSRRLLASAATLAAILLAYAISLLWSHAQSESRKLQLLKDVESRISEGKLDAISTPMEASLGEILAAYRSDRGGTSSPMKAAIRGVHAAFGEVAQKLADEPSLEPAYSTQLNRFLSLVPLIDPENTADWRQTVLPILQARAAFLSTWFASGEQSADRTIVLNDAVQQFSAADEVFARVLAKQSTRQKQVSTRRLRDHLGTAAESASVRSLRERWRAA
jgi:hypothetical protein